MIELRVLTPDDWAVFREVRLAALTEAADTFGSSLREWRDATEARWRQRLEQVPLNVLAEIGGEPAGLASGTGPDEAGLVELISMWVVPSARGKGVGNALVSAVVDWAAAQERGVALWVFENNLPARNLYHRNGFRPVGGERMERPLRS